MGWNERGWKLLITLYCEGLLGIFKDYYCVYIVNDISILFLYRNEVFGFFVHPTPSQHHFEHFWVVVCKVN